MALTDDADLHAPRRFRAAAPFWGSGAGISGFAEMEMPRPKPVRAIREMVTLVRALGSGEEVSQDGEVVRFAGGRLGFKPSRPSLPLWLAGNGPQVQTLGAKIADAVIRRMRI